MAVAGRPAAAGAGAVTIYTRDRVRRPLLEEFTAPLGDALGASFEEWRQDSPGSSLARMLELRNAEVGEPVGIGGFEEGMGEVRPTSPLVDAATARARIAEEGVDLTVPDAGIRREALDILVDRKKQERRRLDTLNRAPEGLSSALLQIGAGFTGSLFDPLNVAAAFVPVVGPSRYTMMLERAGSRLGRAGVRARVGALEGAVGTALLEPLVFAAAAQEQSDYGLVDSLINIAFGTVLGGGLHAGLGAASDAVSKGRPWQTARASDPLPQMLERLPAGTREAALRTAVAQAVSGRTVDVLPVLRSANVNARFDAEPLRAAVGSDVIGLAEVPPARVDASPAATFETAKGSRYSVHEDGTTTRDKAARPDPGHEGDEGIKPKSERTVYLDEEAANALAQPANAPWRIIEHDDGTLSLAVRRQDGKWGIAPSQKNIPVTAAPAVDRVPLELWQRETVNGLPGFRQAHFGNRIVRVESAPAPRLAPVRSAAPAPMDMRAAAEATFAPEAVRLADFEASRQADETLKAAPADEALPDVTLEDTLEDLARLAKVLEARVKPKPFKPELPSNPERKMPARPVIDMLKRAGGVKPGSPLAGELHAMGITARNMPGLFRKRGRGSADNFVRSEIPLFASDSGADDLNGYIDEREILDAIRDELFGAPRRTPEERAAIEEYERIVDQFTSQGIIRDDNEALAKALDEVPPPQSEDDYGVFSDMIEREMAPFDDLQETAEAYGNAVRAAAACGLRRGSE